jgi:hypothetical protein
MSSPGKVAGRPGTAWPWIYILLPNDSKRTKQRIKTEGRCMHWCHGGHVEIEILIESPGRQPPVHPDEPLAAHAVELTYITEESTCL